MATIAVMARNTPAARSTVGEHIERWLAMQRVSGKSPNTIVNYEWAIRGWLTPILGDIPVGELEAEDVEEMLLEMHGAGLAKNSMIRARSVLSQVLKRAVRRGVLDRDVAALAQMPGGPRREGRSLSPDQAKALLDAAVGHRLEAMVVTGLLLGLRPGELAGLRWADVCFQTGVLSVRQARVQTQDGTTLGPTKNDWTRRALEMPQLVKESLQAHQLRQRAEIHSTTRTWQDNDLVFPTRNGTPYDRWAMRRQFVGITRAAGIGDWQLKELRHSFVSLMSAHGIPIESIADLVGHRNARITGEIYRHRVHPTVGAARGVMDSLFSPGPSQDRDAE
ncbi:MAG: tyrosine-type recombinase/integrase [Acidimicrobiales bacterium]